MDIRVYSLLSAVFAALGLTIIMKKRRRKKKVFRKYWVRPWLRRRNLPGKENMLHLYKELLTDGDTQEFQATLRMPPAVYFMLLEQVCPSLMKKFSNFRKPITCETRLAITMRYLALGECFRSLSQQFRVGLSTTRFIVRETCKVIVKVLGQAYLQTPSTKAEWLKVATDFEHRWQFPHCIGCVDGKHIRIIAPRKSGTFFHNYKDYFSVVLMAIVNSDYEFLYIDTGSEGKASDGGIWQQSSFNQYLQDDQNLLQIPDPCEIRGIADANIPFFLIGDDAFRLGPNIMKPFAGTGLTMKKEIFNYQLCRCRRIVENAFGILSCRFKIFRRAIEVNPEYVDNLVMAACILHNFLRKHARNDYIPTLSIDHELHDGNVIPGDWRQQGELSGLQRDHQKNASTYAKNIRRLLADYFITPEGEVDWQYKAGVL